MCEDVRFQNLVLRCVDVASHPEGGIRIPHTKRCLELFSSSSVPNRHFRGAGTKVVATGSLGHVAQGDAILVPEPGPRVVAVPPNAHLQLPALAEHDLIAHPDDAASLLATNNSRPADGSAINSGSESGARCASGDGGGVRGGNGKIVMNCIWWIIRTTAWVY